ncbi:hypothetical protein LPJ59_002430 [Coemansia sp. RSA 2399]|nr:hypothetical protein LPJ59_002430 [Coemansia sp. RSA 2399]KAJ1905088.1 hypothetical protein LPJ81_002119 [Coemansia sp. IMI 209127]
MCGIQVLIQQTGNGEDGNRSGIWDRLTAVNRNRGPDSHKEHVVSMALTSLSADPRAQSMQTVITFGAHVLHLRGPETQSQPIVSKDTEDVLCWNGEVFGGIDVGTRNDGVVLFETLQRTKLQNPKNYILQVFGQIEGPYAFVYLDHEQGNLWFSRDFLGRRSLLMRKIGLQSLLISSVADGVDAESEDSKWTELPAQQMYCLDLADSLWATTGELADTQFKQYSWRYASDPEKSTLVLPFDRVTTELADGSSALSSESISDLDSFSETSKWQPYIDGLERVLTESIRTRVESIPFHHGTGSDEPLPRVGVLFSGGVDCITIAALLTKILPHGEPIELFNVAFENPRQARAHNKAQEPNNSIYDVPDRKTGRQGWLELCELDPVREWRFVEIDVPYDQVLEHRAHVRQLLAPSDTVMDMSIGLALWFASKGIGQLVGRDESNKTGTTYPRQAYSGAARVLLLGMGADEQLGGYSRHRAAWDRGGWPELGNEIQMDVQRIATRNLGRDDRIVSDNSKESRYPFLAAEVVRFLSQTPLDRKMDMRYPRGIGEKLLLRLLAHQIGLARACMLAKRAIQFGARTAKMESGQTKGQDML